MLKNAWFEVVDEVFHFRLDGHRPSNTWIGASRAFDPILRGTNAKAGDVFHLLHGGSFLVKPDGSASSVSFWHPKPLLEKSYGPGNDMMALFRSFEMAGLVREIDRPEAEVDYRAARDVPTFQESHPALAYEETSATYRRLVDAGSCTSEMASDAGLEVKFYDFHLERRAIMHVVKVNPTNRSRILEVQMTERGEVLIKPSETHFELDQFIPAIKATSHNKNGYGGETMMWATSPDILDDTVYLERVGEVFGFIAENAPRAPQPGIRR